MSCSAVTRDAAKRRKIRFTHPRSGARDGGRRIQTGHDLPAFCPEKPPKRRKSRDAARWFNTLGHG
jgi:hypothetical protein